MYDEPELAPQTPLEPDEPYTAEHPELPDGLAHTANPVTDLCCVPVYTGILIFFIVASFFLVSILFADIY